MTHAAVDKDYVPYTKRSVLRSNAGLFVSAIGRGGAGAQVALQAGGCVGKSDVPMRLLSGHDLLRWPMHIRTVLGNDAEIAA